MAKPATLPKWAENDIVDGTSGQNNVIAPSAAKQNSGFLLKEYPTRQTFNWLGRWTWRWLDWLDTMLDQEVSTTSDVTFNKVDITTSLDVGTNATVTGFLKFGEFGQKWKQGALTGSTAGAEGGVVNVDPGGSIPFKKIIQVYGYVDSGTLRIPPHYTDQADYEWTYTLNESTSRIDLKNVAANSANILGKPFYLLIIYSDVEWGS